MSTRPVPYSLSRVGTGSLLTIVTARASGLQGAKGRRHRRACGMQCGRRWGSCVYLGGRAASQHGMQSKSKSCIMRSPSQFCGWNSAALRDSRGRLNETSFTTILLTLRLE